MQKNSSVEYVTVSAEYAGQRIDNFLFTKLKGVPKTHIYRILRKGEVRINKKRVDPSSRLNAGDIIRIPPLKLEVKIPPPKPNIQLIQHIKERILYESKDLLVINKPSGIPVHGGSGVHLGLIEALRNIYPKCPHIELAHRLDAETSGCLVIAKKRSVLKELHELMRTGNKIRKIYWTLTEGIWLPSELKVEAPLHKNQLSSGERYVRVSKEGKTSLTVFKLIENYKNCSLMEATLFTGRTHQIRVHAQYRGHPIAGDEKYGHREWNKTLRQIGLKRLFLHAYSIEFSLSTGEHVKVNAPLDEELSTVLKML